MMTSFVVFLVSAVGLLISAVALPTTSPSSTSKRSDALATLQNAVIKQWQLITQMQSKIATLESRLGKDRPVAFMVSVPYNQDLNVNQRVGFGTPELNVGGGFRTATDSFVAPVSGIYVLFLKVKGQIGTHYTNYMTFQLKKDNAVIAETETLKRQRQQRQIVGTGHCPSDDGPVGVGRQVRWYWQNHFRGWSCIHTGWISSSSRLKHR